MKQITKHLMTRYAWFKLWFMQWFKNAEGIKGFATQAMNTLMQRTMRLAERLKNQNRKLAEEIKAIKAQLLKWYQHPTINADEWDEVRSTVKKLGLWITAGIIAEAALNYFGVSAVITPTGWGWIALNAIIAIVFTGFGIYIFKKWFAVLLNKPMYKQTEVPRRNWADIGMLTLLCIAYEAVIYYLCRVRGIALEGANDGGYVTNFVTLAGMLLPLVAGYLAYERSRILAPYNNTLRIAKAEKNIASRESIIATNNQRMEDHFKRELENTWCVFDEFRIYKENYNARHEIKTESLAGHFCETHETFEREAMQRYTKDVLKLLPVQPTVIISKEQTNGHLKTLTEHNY